MNRKLTAHLITASLLLGVVGCQTTNVAPSTSDASETLPPLTRREVFDARKNFKVEVISFDASKGYGARDPVSGFTDYVRLRITNNSKVTLPYLTVKTIRTNQFDEILGSLRLPSIPVGHIKPGQTAEVDYYPKGHLDASIDKIVVIIELENEINPEITKFFRELENAH